MEMETLFSKLSSLASAVSAQAVKHSGPLQRSTSDSALTPVAREKLVHPTGGRRQQQKQPGVQVNLEQSLMEVGAADDTLGVLVNAGGQASM